MSELKRLLREKYWLDRADRMTFEESLRLSEINAQIYRITRKHVEAVSNPDYEKPSGVEPALQQIREHFKK